MVKLGRTIAVVLLGLSAAGDRIVATQEKRVNPQAEILQDFQDRVKKYMEVHKKAAQDSPRMKETNDPAEIKAAQDAIATNIRAARATAKQGEIFTPEIARHLRQLMYPELKGRKGTETKKVIKEDQPGPIRLKVNARYPDDEPLPTVPPNLLANLPKLPEELEYRVVRNDLILRDVKANLIVDFIPGAIR